MPKGHEKEVSKTNLEFVPTKQSRQRDITNVLHILDRQDVKTSPFGANVSGENSYRRAERISAALHLITNHIPNNEPIRVSIRTSSLDLLADILELRAGFRTPASDKGQIALASIRKLISLSRFLAVAGFVSAENIGAITDALDELGSLIIISQRSTLAEQVTISKGDLTPPAQQTILLRTDTQTTARTRRKRNVMNIKDSRDDILDTPDTNRSDQILDILKVGGILGIKDISANLPQYSQKMVQRELADLVTVGTVSKMGAKRWSKYKIVAR